MEITEIYEKPWFKNWPEEIPKHLEYPEDYPVYKFLEETVQSNPDNIATVFFDKTMKYSELWDRVLRLANSLHKLGVKKGDRVGIYLPNCPQFVIAFFAINRLGALIVPFNTQYVDHELEYQLNDSGARMIICIDITYNRVRKLRKKGIVELDHIIVASLHDEISLSKRILGMVTGKVPPRKRIRPEDFSFKKLVNEGNPNEVPDVTINTKEDLALIQYTGGTTGVSKGAMLTHYNIVSNQIQLNNVIYPPIVQGEECFICALPLFHIFALNCIMMAAVTAASKMILITDPLAGRPMLQDLLETLYKYKPTFFHAVPSLYVGLLFHKDIKDYDLTSIRACLSGAAPLPEQVMYNFEELTGANVVEGYGLTETSPVTHVNPLVEGGKRPGSIGLPVADTDVKIFDPSEGGQDKELSQGQEGEIGIKGPQVMKGYWKKPEETAKTFNSDGYFLTGDIGYIDDEGYFFITGRKKNMIDVSGLKVYPREVEEELIEHPAVQEVAVIGVPHPIKGESVKAFVVLQDDETASEEELIEFCKGRIARYKIPRSVAFLDELPKSAIGKVLHRDLRDSEWKKAGRKRSIDG
ncbi:MAG: long-chain fatty acid--CoA ligase [Candidatus Heimdallarchaeota archaeon]|nr:MAG: long-chain fatty acid--CoA ligase [Candidatus Heimdallarchaeota archaeon]